MFGQRTNDLIERRGHPCTEACQNLPDSVTLLLKLLLSTLAVLIDVSRLCTVAIQGRDRPLRDRRWVSLDLW